MTDIKGTLNAIDDLNVGNSCEIGTGLIVGFDGTPVADRVQVGDALHYLDYSSGNPLWGVDSNDYIQYNRSGNSFSFVIGASPELSISSAGAEIPSGLNVGFSGVPADDVIAVGDASYGLNFNSGNPVINFDSNDFIQYNRASNAFFFNVGGVSQFEVTGSQTVVKSLGAGDVQSDINGVLSVTSDMRLKKDIQDFNRGLNEILSLQPRTYRWNEESPSESNTTYAGFIAQEVMDHIPESVNVGPNGYYGFTDRPIVAALVNSVKEQNEVLNELKKEIEALKNK